METPDRPNDTPGALKQVVLTPHDIPWSLRGSQISSLQGAQLMKTHFSKKRKYARQNWVHLPQG